jgi:signal transduction histidine kinase
MPEYDSLYTEFASPQRASEEDLLKQYLFFQDYTKKNPIIDSFNEFLLILNENRQLVYANKSLLNFLSAKDVKEIIGNRPGELLACQFAVKAKSGCGTDVTCKTCGAVEAILSSLNGIEDIQECSVSQLNNDTVDLRVWTKPFITEIGNFVLFVFSDISIEKRKEVLEKMFFHDITNTVGGILGLSDLIYKDYPENQKEYSQLINKLSHTLIAEINSQKLLIDAERSELTISKSILYSNEIIEELADVYRNHIVSIDKVIEIDNSFANFEFVSDKILLLRVLGNMLKNALEATKDNKVTIGAKKTKENFIFWINNSSFMLEEVQLQIFKRSFSTKGKGRGIGTFSMKLFTEKYLKGKIYFETSEEKGTTFFAELPAVF